MANNNIVEYNKKVLQKIVTLSKRDDLSVESWLDLVETFREAQHYGDLEDEVKAAENALITANQAIKSKITTGEELLKVQEVERILGESRPSTAILIPTLAPNQSNVFKLMLSGGADSSIYRREEIIWKVSITDASGADASEHCRIYYPFVNDVNGTITNNNIAIGKPVSDMNNAKNNKTIGAFPAKNVAQEVRIDILPTFFTSVDEDNQEVRVQFYCVTPSGTSSFMTNIFIKEKDSFAPSHYAGFLQNLDDMTSMRIGAHTVGEVVLTAITSFSNENERPTLHSQGTTGSFSKKLASNLPFYYMRRWVVRNNKLGKHDGAPGLTIDIQGNYKNNVKNPNNPLTGWDADSETHIKFTQLNANGKDQIFVSIPDHYIIDINFIVQNKWYCLRLCSMKPFKVDLTKTAIFNSQTQFNNLQGRYYQSTANQGTWVVESVKVDGFMYGAFNSILYKNTNYLGSYPEAKVPHTGFNVTQYRQDHAKWLHKTSNTQDDPTNLRTETYIDRRDISFLYSIEKGYIGDLSNKDNSFDNTIRWRGVSRSSNVNANKNQLNYDVSGLPAKNAVRGVYRQQASNALINPQSNTGHSGEAIAHNYRGIVNLWGSIFNILEGCYCVYPQKNVVYLKSRNEGLLLNNATEYQAQSNFYKEMFARQNNFSWGTNYPKRLVAGEALGDVNAGNGTHIKMGTLGACNALAYDNAVGATNLIIPTMGGGSNFAPNNNVYSNGYNRFDTADGLRGVRCCFPISLLKKSERDMMFDADRLSDDLNP